MAEDKKTTKDLVLRVLFIIAIVIILIILAFAVIRIIPLVFSPFASVGNIFSLGGNKIAVEVNDPDLNSGDQFLVFWNDTREESGVYSLRYACVDGLELNVVAENGLSRILCNTPYNLNQNEKSIQLEVNLNRKNVFIDLPIEVSFVESAAKKVLASGEVIVGIKNIDETELNSGEGDLSGNVTIVGEPINEESEEEPETPVVVNPRPVSIGPADLSISQAREVRDGVVQFTISNIGSRSSGSWFFRYSVPGEGSETSPLQPSLTPGSSILYTLTFDGNNDGTSIIIVDPNGLISERNESNNSTSVFVNGDGRGSSSNNNNRYDPDDEADLEIEDLEVGRMNGSRFVEDDEIDEDDDAAVRFTVINRGGESTGSWRFEIDETPYDGSNNDYQSRTQSSLRPGESVEIIVEFENPDEGRYNIEVEVDYRDDVDEENERNNDESERLEVRD